VALIEAHVVASELIEFEVGLLCDEPQDLFGVWTHGCTRRSGLLHVSAGIRPRHRPIYARNNIIDSHYR
jgi:hypothetical protein